jgi:glyoxylase-like metal-dependent hydrolase (beta-lactamase superfamily II)
MPLQRRFIRLLSGTISSILLLCLCVSSALADTVNTKRHTVTQLAEGVYEIRHPDAPDEFPQGNTTVIIGTESVLVVDSCYLPSSAREDIAQIRQWTQKPHLGRGNNAGGAIAYLRVEKIVVTGDLLDRPIPYFFSGFPYDEIETLKRLALLDANTVVPGHGDVLHEKSYLQAEADFLRLVTGEVNKAITKLAPGLKNFAAARDEVMKNLDVAALRKQFAIDDTQNSDFFDDTLAGLIRVSWQPVPENKMAAD